MKTLQELKNAVADKSAWILTIDVAKQLKGNRIATIYFGYHGQDGIDEFVIGDIVSEYNYAETIIEGFEEYGNQARYWDQIMNTNQINKMKDRMLLLTADGRNTHIFAVIENDGIFTCSDSDRFVYFIDVPNEN